MNSKIMGGTVGTGKLLTNKEVMLSYLVVLKPIHKFFDLLLSKRQSFRPLPLSIG